MDLAQVLQKIFLKENPDVSINPKYPKFVRSYELNKMKKNLLLLFVTALSLSGNALYGQRITLGAKGGFSFPSLSGGTANNPTYDSNSFKTGEDLGVYGEYHVSSKLSFSLGIEYSTQGGLNKFQAYPIPANLVQTSNGPYLYSDFKSDMNLNYLLLPLLVRQSWQINNKFRLYAGAGPFISILLNANRTISSGSIFEDQGKTTQSIIPLGSLENTGIQKLNAYNVGLNGLIGLSCKLNKKESIFIEIGANYAFLPIQQSSVNGASKPYSESITVGYAFTFKEHYKNRYHKKS